MDYLVILDQGTTSSRCIVFDREANVVSQASQELHRSFPHPGWVEQDAMEIWSTTFAMYAKAMAKEQLKPTDVAAIGITNQRETTIVWNRHTGQPVCMAPVWQCRRGAPLIEKLVADGHSEMIQKKTGLLPDAYFSASKLRWILDNVEGAREGAEAGDLLFGTVDTWLLWKLTAGESHMTDHTNASRTMLFNIHTLEWDQELLDLFDIPRKMLPELRSSTDIFGNTTLGSPQLIPITGIIGDQQAAMIGQCCFRAGEAKATYGTGTFVMMNTWHEAIVSKHGLLTTIAFTWKSDETGETHITYALEGSAYSAGSTLKWLRDGCHLFHEMDDLEKIVNQVDSTDGVYLVPAFNGLGAPYWDSEARGLICGITQGTTPEHIIRAALESIPLRVADILEAMEADSGISLKELRVDGGVSQNDFVMQLQADLLEVDVVRPRDHEATALGAAFTTGIAAGFWDTEEWFRTYYDKGKTVIKPRKDDGSITALKEGWATAIKRARV